MALSKKSFAEKVKSSIEKGKHALNCDFELKEYQKVAISFLLKGDDILLCSNWIRKINYLSVVTNSIGTYADKII